MERKINIYVVAHSNPSWDQILSVNSCLWIVICWVVPNRYSGALCREGDLHYGVFLLDLLDAPESATFVSRVTPGAFAE